jgi:hypothetical protein
MARGDDPLMPWSEVPVWIRPQRKLLLAVAELHSRGYEQLRIVPHIGGAGFWRCHILPACHISSVHGARGPGKSCPSPAALYTSGSGGRDYWGWHDDDDCEPAELGEVFLRYCADVARLGRGPDSAYVLWYLEMLRVTHPDSCPIAYDTDPLPRVPVRDDRLALLRRPGQWMALPPGGLCMEERGQRGESDIAPPER